MMQGKDLLEKIREVSLPCIASHNLTLVDITYYYMANRLVVRFFIDRPEGGITLDECAVVNEELGTVLDSCSWLEQSYMLEVSSPGVDRNLKTRDDFKRVMNRTVIFFLHEPVNGKIEWSGVVKHADDECVYVGTGSQEIAIPYRTINKSKQVID